VSGRRWRISISGNQAIEREETHRGLRDTGPILIHHVARELHVAEHALEVLSKLVAALDLELGDHALFCIVRDAPAGEEPLAEVVLVVALEKVLVCQESEEDYGLVKNVLKDGGSLR
jgi:hypothetical protein